MLTLTPLPSAEPPLAMAITAIDPAFGSKDGGETVRIHLTRVRSGATVTIGGVAATVTGGQYGIGGYLDVTTPAGSVGAADVVVSGYHGTDTIEDGFSFQAGAGGGAAPDVVFHSDWSTGTGSTASIIRDTGQDVPWSQNPPIGGGWGDGAVLNSEIIARPVDRPFSTTNVFQVVCPFTPGSDASGACIPRHTLLPVPAVGESLFYRWEKSVELPDELPPAFDNQWHPFQDGQAAGSSNWMWNVIGKREGDASIPVGQWKNEIFLQARTGAHRRFSVLLDLRTVYRFELHVLRTATNEFEVETRVYDEDGVLLYDASDYVSEGGGGVTLADVTSPFVDVNSLAGLNCGQNDVQALGGTSMLAYGEDLLFGYQAAVAVSTTTWCGAYAGGI